MGLLCGDHTADRGNAKHLGVPESASLSSRIASANCSWGGGWSGNGNAAAASIKPAFVPFLAQRSARIMNHATDTRASTPRSNPKRRTPVAHCECEMD